MCDEFKVKVAKLLFFYNVCAKYFYELLFFFMYICIKIYC